jgi:hypothetical protein
MLTHIWVEDESMFGGVSEIWEVEYSGPTRTGSWSAIDSIISACT